MMTMKIVSLLPSATEIVFALDLGEDLRGVSFECDYPEPARSVPIVSGTALPTDGSLSARRSTPRSAPGWRRGSPSTPSTTPGSGPSIPI